MRSAAFRPEERVGLVLAVLLHAGLLAVLWMQPAPKPVPVPERIQVTISDEMALESRARSHEAQVAPETAPTLGEAASAPVAVSTPEPPKPVTPEPRPVVKTQPAPNPEPPRPTAKPKPEPVKPQPKPAKVQPRPAPPKPAPHATPGKSAAKAIAKSRPDPIAAIVGTGRPTRQPAKKAGASRIGDDFLKGIEGAPPAKKSAAAGAATISAEDRAGLSSSIARQLKPRWVAPQGADAEKLVTILAWNLNQDGTLDGKPRVIRQEGITDSNRPQAQRHAEQAIRAVELAAPFDLPAKFYPAWKRIAAFRFDRKLSQ